MCLLSGDNLIISLNNELWVLAILSLQSADLLYDYSKLLLVYFLYRYLKE